MRYSAIRHAPLLALAILATACAPRAERQNRALFRNEVLRPDSVIVRVVSRHDRALSVYLARNYTQTKLGDIAPGAEARFALLAADVVPTGFALVVTPPNANETMRTVPLKPRRGQVVRFEIAPKLAESRALINWPPRCETCSDPLRGPQGG